MITKGIEFSFSEVIPAPAGEKGPLKNLFRSTTERLEIKSEKLPLPVDILTLNEHHARTAMMLTRGTLEAICGSTDGNKYVVLTRSWRKFEEMSAVLCTLPEKLTATSQELVRQTLRILLENAEVYGRAYGSRAVLVIRYID